jgi:hypothetical protein
MKTRPAHIPSPCNDRFTPRQILTIVLTVAIVVLSLPVGAAAAGSLMTIVDSKSSAQARVTTGGQLSVTEMPRAAIPWELFIANASSKAVFIPPAGKTTLALSTVTVSNLSASPSRLDLELLPSASCTGNVTYEFSLAMPANDTREFTFPEPYLVYGTGSDWCLLAAGNVSLTASGFYY